MLGAIVCTIGVLFRKLLLMPVSSRVLSHLSSSRLGVSVLISRPSIHFGVILVHSERYRLRFDYLSGNGQFSQHRLLKRPSFLQDVLWLLPQRSDS